MTEAEKTKRIVTITRCWLGEFNAFKNHYDEIEQGYDYLAGVQYDDNQLKWFETVRRPARVFNLIFPLFNQILGDFLLNDQKIHVYPLPGGEAKTADLFQDLLDHANLQNDSKSVLMQYALSGVVKMGYIFPRFSDEKELDGSLVFSHVDEFEVLFDSAATDYFLDDAQYLARSRWLTKSQILQYFQAHAGELKQLLMDREDMSFWDRLDPDSANLLANSQVSNEREGKYRIIEWHEKRFEEVEVAIDTMTGQSQIWSLEGKKADLFFKVNPNAKIIRRRDEVKTITEIIPGLNYFLSERKADLQDRTFDLIPFSAYNYGRRAIQNYGLFKNSVGPQDDFNSWQNQSNALINIAVNPGITYKPDALKNPKQVELYGNAPGTNYQIKSEYQIAESIRQNEGPKLPFAPAQLAGERGDLLQKITGITPNMMGVQETKQENASLFAQRVNQAKTALQVLYNNFSRSKRRMYNKCIQLMQENYDTTRYFLITQPETKEQKEIFVNVQIGEQVLNDIRTGRYQVIADDMERNPTAKQIRFLQKTEVVQTVLTMFAAVPIPPDAIVIILDWWLSESDLGDIDKFIAAFAGVLSQQQAAQTDEMQKQSAMQDVGALLDLASKKNSLDTAGLSAIGGPGNKQAAMQQ